MCIERVCSLSYLAFKVHAPYYVVICGLPGPAIFFKLLHRHHHHHYKHQGLDPLIRSVSRVTAARANASSVFQLFSFLVVCSGMISKGFGFVA